ncbi:uncharacterized protein PITG_11449 [Phytophthora infestans T30-4]|uniref:Uncharacterized protein n=1 Tax=Phytophthora infestans (strain T30-4) TaxID=403677 RepID=D0NIT2_PHYIT|nr:uncharacterized protein PITG_11449 [Phytophthora infestans T30-4]EEY59416.1 conserved hypothetical protein [Phytophthora infestans T30-4]|eukprot:XP_002901026.1 conserved hypothetical protein [Phytophthora infestans T30-4]
MLAALSSTAKSQASQASSAASSSSDGTEVHSTTQFFFIHDTFITSSQDSHPHTAVSS